MASERRVRRGLRRWAALGAGALLFTGCGSAASHAASHASSAASVTYTLSSGGVRRSYIVYAPPARASARRPLVLVYHGALDTAANTQASTDLDQAAARRGLIVAFMQGYANTWNEGAGHTPAERAGIDDVAFTAAVLGQIESRY